MGARLAAVLTAVSFGLLGGCGDGSLTPTMHTATVSPSSGNWAFSPANPLAGDSISLPPFLGGSLMVSGGQISADFLVLPVLSACPVGIGANFDVQLTGSVSNNQLTLTSMPWNGGVFTITGAVASDGNSFTGQWSVKGGCATGAGGALVASYVPSVTGTWSGVLAALPGQTANGLTGAAATLQLVQSSTPTAFSFPLSGTIAISGSTCGFSSGTLVQLPGSDPLDPSSVIGQAWTAEAQMSDGKSVVVAVGVENSLSPGAWLVDLTVAGGACDGAFGTTTVSLQ